MGGRGSGPRKVRNIERDLDIARWVLRDGMSISEAARKAQCTYDTAYRAVRWATGEYGRPGRPRRESFLLLAKMLRAAHGTTIKQFAGDVGVTTHNAVWVYRQALAAGFKLGNIIEPTDEELANMAPTSYHGVPFGDYRRDRIRKRKAQKRARAPRRD